MTALPPPVAGLAAQLAALPGAVAVVLGGSRATGMHRRDSDWDLGLYYRGTLAPEDVRALGHPGFVSGLGEWGPIVNGGAWLTLEGTEVDVLYRNLDTVEASLAEAEHGRFAILAQNGYVAGAPTYLPVGELALCVPLHGDVPRPEFPPALAASAPERWRGQAAVALLFAQTHAAADDAVPCAGMLAHAVLCVAHARMAERREWVLNEKRLVRRAGLEGVQGLIGAEAGLPETVAAVAGALGVEPLAPR